MTGVICLAVYRPSETLFRRQVESIRNQTESAWTCHIGIDGLDLEAYRLVCEVVGNDRRFLIHHFRDNLGFYKNFERLLDLLPHDVPWIALSDQDDEWFPNKLAQLIPRLEFCSLALGEVLVLDLTNDGSVTRAVRRPSNLSASLIDNQVTGSACIFRGELLDVALPFPPKTNYAYHDHWLGVCALIQGGIDRTEDPLQYYIQHSENIIGERIGIRVRSRLDVLRSHGNNRLFGQLAYLRDQRWGWRVNMAKQALANCNQISIADKSVLEMFAASHLSFGLFSTILRLVLRREVPVLRALGLLAGSAACVPRIFSQRGV